MTTTTSTSASSAAAAASSIADATAKSALGKDDFLKLMIVQLQNQDPLNPMDNQAFVAQLAQFSNLEQLQQVNKGIDSLSIGQAGANQQAAANLVGRDVTFRSDQVGWKQGDAGAAIGAQLGANADSLTATITDASGRVVRTLRYGPQSSGTFSASWDGADDAGNVQPTGNYTIKFTAADPQKNPVTAVAQGSGHVAGVSFANGVAELVLGNGIHVALPNVIEVQQPKH